MLNYVVTYRSDSHYTMLSCLCFSFFSVSISFSFLNYHLVGLCLTGLSFFMSNMVWLLYLSSRTTVGQRVMIGCFWALLCGICLTIYGSIPKDIFGWDAVMTYLPEAQSHGSHDKGLLHSFYSTSVLTVGAIRAGIFWGDESVTAGLYTLGLFQLLSSVSFFSGRGSTSTISLALPVILTLCTPLLVNHMMVIGYADIWLTFSIMLFLLSVECSTVLEKKRSKILLLVVACIPLVLSKETGLLHLLLIAMIVISYAALKRTISKLYFGRALLGFIGMFVSVHMLGRLFTDQALFALSWLNYPALQFSFEPLYPVVTKVFEHHSFGGLLVLGLLISLKWLWTTQQGGELRVAYFFLGYFFVVIFLCSDVSILRLWTLENTFFDRMMLPLAPVAALITAIEVRLLNSAREGMFCRHERAGTKSNLLG